MIKYDKIVLGADVGGTNTNFMIIGIKNRALTKLFHHHEQTALISNFPQVVCRFLASAHNHGFTIEEACFSIAGPLEKIKNNQRVEMTNTDLIIDTRELIAETSLHNVLLLNDFEAISYAINILTEKDVKVLNNGRPVHDHVCAVIGPGTGLGKSILYYNPTAQAYLPLASEGGHADLPLLDDEDAHIAGYIARRKGTVFPISYEDVLSGKGLETLYSYLARTKYPNVPQELSAQELSKTKSINPCSKETFGIFIKYCARCARNFSLDAYARGGLYIAGGIAAKNSDSFTSFMIEFQRNETYGNMLKKIPVKIITNYDISPFGAAFALMIQEYI